MAFFGLFVVDRDVSRNKEKKTHISERYRHEKSLKKKAKRKHSHNQFQTFLKKNNLISKYALSFSKDVFSIIGVIFQWFHEKKRECFFKNHFIPLLCNVNISRQSSQSFEQDLDYQCCTHLVNGHCSIMAPFGNIGKLFFSTDNAITYFCFCSL